MSPDEIITLLELKPLPFEGGYYRETFRTEETAVPFRLRSSSGAASSEPGHRAYGTAIYYLVTQENFSAFHLVESDEIFHFYLGDPVELVCLTNTGTSVQQLGVRLLQGEQPQILVPKNTWQGLRVKPGGEWALLGCTVSPGFDFSDFHLGERTKLEALFPECRQWIQMLTREER